MFTGHQLTWLAAALLPLYVLLRAHLALQAALPLCLPWLATATAMAFGRCRGRALDAFAGDWALFQLQPKALTHPGSRPGPALFTPIDRLDRGALPWSPP